MPPTLETERLHLRPFIEDDIEPSYEVFEGHDDVWRYDPGFQRTREQRTAIIRRYIAQNYFDDVGTLAVIHKETGRLMGYVGLQLYVLPSEPFATPEVELYYKLGRDWWGAGYAHEACIRMLDFAFNEMRLARIVTVAAKENERSLRLMRRLEMQIQDAPPKWDDSYIGILINPKVLSSGTTRDDTRLGAQSNIRSVSSTDSA